MTAKQYMQQYAKWKATIENLIAELKAIEMDCIMPQGIRYDQDRVQHTSSSDGMIKLIEEMDRRKSEVIDKIRMTREKMNRMEDEVNRIDNANHKRLLHLYYIEGVRPLDTVADKMGFSVDKIKHMHGEALRDIEIKSNTLKH